MRRMVQFSITPLLVLILMNTPPVWADNEGQADLDQATGAKLNAEKIADLAEVIQHCETALEKGLDPENTVFAKSLLASTLVQRATASGTAIFKEGPVDPHWRDLREAALADLEKAVKLVPNQPDALLSIARLNLLPGGNVKRATETLDQALGLETEEPEARIKILMLRSGLEKDNKKRLTLLDEAVRLAPQNAEPVRARGLLHADMGKPEPALADLNKAVELDPENATTYQAQAWILSDLKRFDEALVSLDKAQQLKPGSVAPLTMRVQIHVQQKNMDAALRDLNLAHSRQPKNVVVLLLRANLYHELDKPEKALADVDKAIELRPDFDRARRLRAMLLVKAGKLDQVIAELEKLRERTPKDIEVQAQLAMLYTAKKQPSKAAKIFTAILAQKPDNVAAMSGRANAMLGMGKHADAIADYDKALKLAPDDSGMLNNLAWVLATSPDDKLRNGKRAIELAKKACELTDYKQAHILSTLAAAHAESGDFETALKWSKKAIELGKESEQPGIQEALDKELKSYEAKKPWRELLQEGLEPAPKAEQKTPSPAAKGAEGEDEARHGHPPSMTTTGVAITSSCPPCLPGHFAS